MLWTIAVIMLVLWLMGLITSYAMSGLYTSSWSSRRVVLLRVIRGRKISDHCRLSSTELYADRRARNEMNQEVNEGARLSRAG
jgi:hypothetical protein